MLNIPDKELDEIKLFRKMVDDLVHFHLLIPAENHVKLVNDIMKHVPTLLEAYTTKQQQEHYLRAGTGTQTVCSCGKSFGLADDARQHIEWQLKTQTYTTKQQHALLGWVLAEVVGADDDPLLDNKNYASATAANKLRFAQRQIIEKKKGSL